MTKAKRSLFSILSITGTRLLGDTGLNSVLVVLASLMKASHITLAKDLAFDEAVSLGLSVTI